MAQHLPDGMQVKARVGYSIGGTTPIPLPATIRSIDAFRLTPSLMVGADAWLPVGRQWGVSAGLRVENKAMDADATVKGYHMEMVQGTTQLEGIFTGQVCQKVKQWMLTVPVQATWQPGRKVTLKAGPYVSLLFSRGFNGIASDGYLRQGDPTGPRVTIGNDKNTRATYDFHGDMRRVQLGVGAGVDWQCWQDFGLSADLNWGLTGIFPGSFKTVEQALYPVYGTVGVFYRIK
ncbi:MAG: PorT family protein [Bacteroidaceae bacterium]|nr:PorT family protein [Bacteroidaceae bacterium]